MSTGVLLPGYLLICDSDGNSAIRNPNPALRQRSSAGDAPPIAFRIGIAHVAVETANPRNVRKIQWMTARSSIFLAGANSNQQSKYKLL